MKEKGILPSADVLGKPANALEVTSGYLMMNENPRHTFQVLTKRAEQKLMKMDSIFSAIWLLALTA